MKHLSIAQELGDRAGKGRAFGNLGNSFHSLGQFQQAIEYHGKHLSIAEELGDRAGKGRAFGNCGNSYHSLGNFQQAMVFHKKQLRIAVELGDRAGEGRAYGNLGNSHQDLGNFPQAIEYHKKNLSIAMEVDDKAGEGRAIGNLGNVYKLVGDFQRAVEYHKKQMSIAKGTDDKEGEVRACINLGLALSSRSLNEALAYFRDAAEAADNIRANNVADDVLKISFRELYDTAYACLWQCLIMLRKTDDALHAAEWGRAEALADALKIKYGVTSLSASSIKPEEVVTYVSHKISVSTVFLAQQDETLNIWVLGKERKVIFRQKKLKLVYHRLKDHETDPLGVILEMALKTIRAGRGVRCENRTMDEVKDEPISRGEDDYPIRERPIRETIEALTQLYEVVLAPIEDLLDEDEIIVVPTGILAQYPWASLSQSIKIRTFPSLTTLKLITDSPDNYHCKSGALLVGDPCMKKITNRGGHPIFPQLKYAKKEVEMIGEILNCHPLTGEAATKEAVLQRMGSVALIHFAAHGSKEAGEIAFAPNPGWQSKIHEEDYLLRISDVQAIKLRARLVVLSCCHSAQGEVNSEGIVGMARAFLFAGARSVLATLWPIDDEATLIFMRSFYHHLRGGESSSYALQKAIKCLRDSHDYSSPKYWAPFVLIGDDFHLTLSCASS